MTTRTETSINKTLLKLYIKSVTDSDLMTNKIMSFIFSDDEIYKIVKCDSGHFYKITESKCPYCVTLEDEVTNIDVVSEYKSSKVDEISSSLEYLKSKESKTKKDLENIYMLEMILKNYS
jgi:hypothetical protein